MIYWTFVLPYPWNRALQVARTTPSLIIVIVPWFFFYVFTLFSFHNYLHIEKIIPKRSSSAFILPLYYFIFVQFIALLNMLVDILADCSARMGFFMYSIQSLSPLASLFIASFSSEVIFPITIQLILPPSS